MKRYLLDTNILIELIKSKPSRVKGFFDSLEGKVVLPYVASGELIQGARDKNELKKIMSLLGSFEIDWGGREVSKKTQEILIMYTLKNGLDLWDAQIAAIAISGEFTLVSLNMKHFRMIEGLVVEGMEL